jgi:hypothetical protein
MADWKNPSDYKFTDKAQRRRWVWEFMRRNPQYRKDYAKSRRAWKRVPRNGYFFRTGVKLDTAERLSHLLGAKWWQLGEIADPARDKIPAQLVAFPIRLHYSDIDTFYIEAGESGSVLQVPGYVTMTFDVSRPISPQLTRAGVILEKYAAKVEKEHSVNKGRGQWPLYLRVLDALEAGASRHEIINEIVYYKKMKKPVDGKYRASTHLSNHIKSAKVLLANPVSLFR